MEGRKIHRLSKSSDFRASSVSPFVFRYSSNISGFSERLKSGFRSLKLIENQKITEPIDFAYRVGYGFQYYLKGSWGFAIEGGYGDGAYVKAGLFWWFY